MTFDKFISDEEADSFISTTAHHFKRSLAGDMVSPVRTSQQAWCQYGIAPDCVNHPLVNRVHERVVNITGVPKPNAEFFQVLKYEPGQFCECFAQFLFLRSLSLSQRKAQLHACRVCARAQKPTRLPKGRCLSSFSIWFAEGAPNSSRVANADKTHHDQNSDAKSLAGVRLFTFFIYLHTPESGGQTFFPSLNISIEPKRGAALLWPNVKDSNLHAADMRTEHEAKPPLAGQKFSANLWLHQYDFRGPNVRGCDLGKRLRTQPPRKVEMAALERADEGEGDVAVDSKEL